VALKPRLDLLARPGHTQRTMQTFVNGIIIID
jgi:hypothetical protein